MASENGMSMILRNFRLISTIQPIYSVLPDIRLKLRRKTDMKFKYFPRFSALARAIKRADESEALLLQLRQKLEFIKTSSYINFKLIMNIK